MVMANNTTSTIQRLGKSKKYFQMLRSHEAKILEEHLFYDTLKQAWQTNK